MEINTCGNGHNATAAIINTDRFFFHTLPDDITGPVSTIVLDGGTPSTKVMTVGINTPPNTTGGIGKGTGIYNGVIQRTVVLNRVATVAEQQKLEGWESWNGKAGANLPAGHPYKTQAPLASDP